MTESDVGSAHQDNSQPSEQNQGDQLDKGVALDAKQVPVHANASGLVPRSRSSLPESRIRNMLNLNQEVCLWKTNDPQRPSSEPRTDSACGDFFCTFLYSSL